mmetsp:Transcript_14718/g.33156  ORF Transcript_14718/g.33156 Transcript_14718/m.33156 type:complete len:115 (-) Transcript_14718:82-426(-)
MTKKQKRTSNVIKNSDKIPVPRIRRKRKNRKRSSTITKRDNKKKLRQSIDKRDNSASSRTDSLNQCKQLPPTQENPVDGKLLPPFLKHCKPEGTESKPYSIWHNTMSFLKPESN